MIVSRREKILLLFFICLAIFTGFYKLYYEPLHQQLVPVMSQNSQLQKHLTKLKKEAKTQVEREKIVEEYQALLEKLPPEPLLLEATRYFEQVANQSGVELLSITCKNTLLN